MTKHTASDCDLRNLNRLFEGTATCVEEGNAFISMHVQFVMFLKLSTLREKVFPAGPALQKKSVALLIRQILAKRPTSVLDLNIKTAGTLLDFQHLTM